jgi:GNAT superfamily N-acetyltransferase
MNGIDFRVRPALTNGALNALFSVGWPSWQQQPDRSDWQPVLAHSLAYVGAFADENLVGFANVAWDGRDHAFLLDPRVHPDYRRRGLGVELVRRCAALAREAGCEWLHVDFAPELARFYDACRFQSTPAGLMHLAS